MASRFQLVSWELLAAVTLLACGACGGPTTVPTAPSQNGIYAVVNEAATAKEARRGDDGLAVLPYDRKYTGAASDVPLSYVAIDPVSFVPLVLEGAPDAEKDGGGKTILSVTLEKEYVKVLEDFTRDHLNDKIAILLDGEIVTLHKIRSVISDGRFQVTRCTDNACEILRAKLME